MGRFVAVTLVAASAVAATSNAAAPYDPAPDAAVAGLTPSFADVAGQRTRFYDYGEGEPMLLVHGGGRGTTSSANNFAPVIPLLAEHFHVLAVDKSAAGMTDNPLDDADLSYEGEAKHLYKFIQTMELGPVHLVGHSSGGATAFFLAVMHPEVVKTFTIVSSGPGMPPAGEGLTLHDAREAATCTETQLTYAGRKCRLELLGHTPGTFDEEFLLADAWMAEQPKSAEARAKYAAARSGSLPGGTQTLGYTERMWERARTEGMQMPIMIITGKQDTLSWDSDEPVAMLRSELGFFDIVGDKSPRVKMVVLNEAGHFPYRDQKEQFTAELVNFIGFWRAHPKRPPPN